MTHEERMEQFSGLLERHPELLAKLKTKTVSEFFVDIDALKHNTARQLSSTSCRSGCACKSA